MNYQVQYVEKSDNCLREENFQDFFEAMHFLNDKSSTLDIKYGVVLNDSKIIAHLRTIK